MATYNLRFCCTVQAFEFTEVIISFQSSPGGFVLRKAIARYFSSGKETPKVIDNNNKAYGGTL